MKSVVIEKPGVMVFKDSPIPEIPEGFVRVKVKAAAVCATDLEVIDGNDSEIRVGTLFRFFKQNYFKTVRLNFWYIIVMQLYLIPLWIGAIAGGAIFASQMMTGSEQAALIGVLAFAGLTFIGAVISIIIYYPITYAYSMAHMIMADAPDVGAIEALRLSRQMMQGNKWRLFCLDFSFIGWILLGSLTCGILYFMVYPYMYAARAAFYESIKGAPVWSAAEAVESPAEEASTEA